MAEAIGAFYAVETLVEGAAAGALAVSGSTVPLHAKFQKIQAPAEIFASCGSQTKLIKNKLYIIGGEQDTTDQGYGIRILSFKPDFSTSKTTGSVEVDYEFLKPELTEGRPLSAYAVESKTRVSKSSIGHHAPWARFKHSTVAINDYIYIIGGFESVSRSLRRSSTQSFIPFDTIARYDTLTRKYTIITADWDKCTEGLPSDRYGASCTASPYPPSLPVLEDNSQSLFGLNSTDTPSDDHGTIFLHGGYDMGGHPTHDTWSFDLGTRAWHKLPTIVEEALENKSFPGQISYVERRLWYTNRSSVMYLELSELDSIEDVPKDAPATGRVGSGQWQVAFPSPEKDPAALIPEGGRTKEEDTQQPETVPSEITAHILPVTTGAGRTYLISIGQENPQSMYLFQIPAASMTAASLKDAIRDKASAAISAVPESGKFRWSKVEVIQSNMEEGELERPNEQLNDFAVCSWKEYGDKFVIWGGQIADRKSKDGWVISLD